MKKLTAVLVALTLTACAGAPQNALKFFEAKAAYQRVDARHDVLVREFQSYKEKFSVEERVALVDSLEILALVKSRVEAMQSATSDVEKAALVSKLLENYDYAKLAYSQLIMVIEPHLSKMPLTLRLEASQQIRDVKTLDSAVQTLLANPEGGDYRANVSQVLNLVGTLAQIAKAAAI